MTEPRHLHPVTQPDTHDDPDPTERSPRDHTERALLGALLNNPVARDQATQIIQGTDLSQHRYELIYDSIVDLYAAGHPVDPLTVADHLGPNLPRIGGLPELLTLAAAGYAVIDPTYYANIIARQAARDRLDKAAIAIHQLATKTSDDTNPADLHAAALTHLEQAATRIPGIDPTDTPHPWKPEDLTPILDGTHTTPTATTMTRRDGKHLLYPYAVHSISGEPGSCKTWAALVATAQALEDGQPALFIDFEDRATSVVNRLRALGVTPTHIAAGLRYIRPETALDPTGWTHLAQAAQDCPVAVIDGITEAMTLHGLSLMDNEDVARWLALLPTRIANLGPAVVQIDHVVKNADNRGRYAIGGQHKLAGITGVAYKILTIKPAGKGVKGHAKLVIDKDKHGDVGPTGITAADLYLDATTNDGTIYAWLDTPGSETTEDGHFRPTTLMTRVSTFVETHPGSTLRAIRTGVRGKAESIADAVAALLTEGYLRGEDRPQGGQFYWLVEPFKDPR